MIVPFPTPRERGQAASDRVVAVGLAFWFWWLPQPKCSVVYLDDYRHSQRKRKQANA
jgi:hypothetical protein